MNRPTILCALAVILSAATAPAQTTRPTPPADCVVGVWGVPIRDFATWKGRGANTLVAYEPQNDAQGKPTVSLEQWTAAAKAAGFRYIRQPSADLAADAKDPDLIAFLQDDEPDLNRWKASEPADGPTNAGLISAGGAKGWRKPEPYASRYASWKAAAPTKPAFVNFAGPTVTSDAYRGELHLPYVAAADWVGHDWYPKNKNADRYPIAHIGKAMDRLAAWSSTGPTNAPPVMTPGAGKPQLVFIECSDQDISTLGRAPTPDEFEEEVVLAIARGARGVVYFPQHPPPGFKYDATPPEIGARMLAVNAWLRSNAAAQPPPPPATKPTIDPVVAELTARVEALSGEVDRANAASAAARAEIEAAKADVAARFENLRRALTPDPTTQPTTMPATQPSAAKSGGIVTLFLCMLSFALFRRP